MLNPIIVYANYHQFRPDENIHWDAEQSRMLLCCRSGEGRVLVNGECFTLNPGSYLFLPWNRETTYFPSKDKPFLIAAAHIVPDYDKYKPFIAQSVSRPEASLRDCPWRKDASLGVLDGIIAGHSILNPALDPLVDFIIQTVYCREPEEWLCRQLAHILLKELNRIHEYNRLHHHDLPHEMQKAIRYISDNYTRQISTEEIVSIACVSRSTLRRMFLKYFDQGVVEYIRDRRMREAKRLLSITPLPVGEIGRLVGYEDPYYFSKMFTHHWGMCPSTYRRTKRIM